MLSLNTENFICEFERLVQNLDYASLRQHPLPPDSTFTYSHYSHSQRLILLFTLKWTLAFKRFNLAKKIQRLRAGKKSKWRTQLHHMTTRIEKEEKIYYQKKLNTNNNAYQLKPTADWAVRFLFTFNVSLINGRAHGIHSTVVNFIDLMTTVSTAVDFFPYNTEKESKSRAASPNI